MTHSILMQHYAVVIVSRPGYVHSEAFREIAETVVHGLRGAGHDAVFSDTAFVAGRIPIVFGANLVGHTAELPAHAIVYNLEQIEDGSVWMNEPYLSILRSHMVWDYSARNIAALKARGITNVHHLPIGYVRQLERIEPAAVKDIGVLFYGSMNPRRKHVINALKAAGANVVSVFGVYGHERDALIARAKIVLNIHFYESKIFEAVRVSYLLSNGVCVVSEDGPDPIEKAYSDAVAFSDYEHLVQACMTLLRDDDRRERLSRAGLALMRAAPQERYIEEFLMSAPRPEVPSIAVPSVLNIGSGKDWRPDCLNVDIAEEWGPDIVFDLNAPLPEGGLTVETSRFGSLTLKNNAFDAILCNDVLEHLSGLTTAMTTCLRLLKVGGVLKITVPYDLSWGAWQEPTHVRAFNERSWTYYTDWFWYLDWDTWRFDMKSLQFIASPIGQKMHQMRVDQETILRTPRAIDAMLVELVKRELTSAEKAERAARHERRRAPVSVSATL